MSSFTALQSVALVFLAVKTTDWPWRLRSSWTSIYDCRYRALWVPVCECTDDDAFGHSAVFPGSHAMSCSPSLPEWENSTGDFCSFPQNTIFYRFNFEFGRIERFYFEITGYIVCGLDQTKQPEHDHNCQAEPQPHAEPMENVFILDIGSRPSHSNRITRPIRLQCDLEPSNLLFHALTKRIDHIIDRSLFDHCFICLVQIDGYLLATE